MGIGSYREKADAKRRFASAEACRAAKTKWERRAAVFSVTGGALMGILGLLGARWPIFMQPVLLVFLFYAFVVIGPFLFISRMPLMKGEKLSDLRSLKIFFLFFLLWFWSMASVSLPFTRIPALFRSGDPAQIPFHP